MESVSNDKDRKEKRNNNFSPTRRIALSFLLVILIGAFFLAFTFMNQGDTGSFLDHLFVATSATCVTGLVPFTVCEQYTIWGQLVILVLIQIGGLGFLTLLNLMMVLLGRRLSYTNKMLMQEALNQNSIASITTYLKRVIMYTAFFEILGAVLLSVQFIGEFGIAKGIYYAIFHSVSAFCNAGFDLLGGSSLICYQTNVYMNIVVSGLIIAGGLGFVVWIDLADMIKKIKEKGKSVNFKRLITSLALQTKIVVVMTLALLGLGAAVFFVLEYNNPGTIGDLRLFDKIMASFFQSVTYRTAGFATIPMVNMKDSTKLFSCVLMFIGGSPAGTAGGIKTTTIALVLLHIRSLVTGNENINLCHRTIPDQVVRRALSIAIVSFFIAITALFAISLCESTTFIDLVYEVFSAFGTVGVSADVTSTLSSMGKVIIIVLMYTGRIGPISMLLMFTSRYNQKKGKKSITYPKGDVLIG